MKKMDLSTTDGQFKINDTNTTLHFAATVDGGSQHLTDLTNGQSWDRTFGSNGFSDWRQVTQWN